MPEHNSIAVRLRQIIPVPIITLLGTTLLDFPHRHAADWFHIIGEYRCYRNQFSPAFRVVPLSLALVAYGQTQTYDTATDP
jgi:hypothetical protein